MLLHPITTKEITEMKWSYFFSLVLVFTGLTSCRDKIAEDLVSKDTSETTEVRSLSNSVFYWHNGERIFLFPDNEKEYILFRASDEDDLLQSASSSVSNVKQGELPLHTTALYIPKQLSNLQRERLKWAVVPKAMSLSERSEVLYHGNFYTNEKGQSLGLSHLLYVKLKSEDDFEMLKEWAKQYNLWIVSQNEYMPLWYTLATIQTNVSTLDLANILHDTGLFDTAQPDVMVDEDLTLSNPNDPLFPTQWGLKNTGQEGGSGGFDIGFSQAYAITQGRSDVIVAVIDHGIALSHPDLNLYSSSYDTERGTSPSVIRGSHGTACAGIIGAKSNNGIGVTGIASASPLMSISNNLKLSPDIAQKLANGFSFAWRNGAAVISNSWGGLAPSSILEDAIKDAIRKGRNGKGCVVVFASGNDNSSQVKYPASSIPEILVVGAMSPCGERKSLSSCDGETWGSNYGEALDIVAPGVKIQTTDLPGSDGYSPGHYFASFNGTSSACPHVAAVAALLISVKPELTQKEVARAILTSARKLGSYSFSQLKSYGYWSPEVGYGLVNASSALQYVMGSNIVYFNDEMVSHYESVFGGRIYARNIVIRKGAKLLFTPQEVVEITPSFIVEKGGEFEVSFFR